MSLSLHYENLPDVFHLPEVIYCEGNKDGVYVEVALQHNDSFNDSTFSFVNNIITPDKEVPYLDSDTVQIL